MIRKIEIEDRTDYLLMARDFYASEAVYRNVPDRHFEDTFDELMRSDRYALGYILQHEGQTAGYALLAKTFSQEAGGMVVWLDELYVMPAFRSLGLGRAFFEYLHEHLPPDVRRIRLEVEADNERAISLYRRLGFEDLPYCQMIQDLKRKG